MHYLSTRGEAPSLDFVQAMLAGLARDGGLYVPAQWPTLSADTIRGFAGKPYDAVAAEVLAPLVGGSLTPETLRGATSAAYAAFAHPAVAPLTQIAPGTFLLDLSQGPTLAFKDIAMQLLARLMDHALAERGERATIVGATSGDTGSAAIEAFADSSRVDVVILYPHGRVSDVQRRMMTTSAAANTHAVAIEGTFDDCQAIVKALFNKPAFRDRVALSAINSINWARIAAQVVYYFTSAVALGAPDRPMRFVVPTGNFGDIFAGYVASRMGLPIERLTIATNVNDILVRALASGDYACREVIASTSPSMDIQVSSNFERLLFDASGRDAASVRGWMRSLAQSGRFSIDEGTLATIRREFSAARADEDAVAATIRDVHAQTGLLIDPHTAIGAYAAQQEAGEAPETPRIVLSTAHPAKFPDAVSRACGVHPALPERLADLAERPERTRVLPADAAAVEQFVLSVSRAVRSGVPA